MTLVVNLYGGPGTGKSTTAALVFGRLKEVGVNAELVHEFAKDLTWEERHGALAYQPYIIGEQMWRIHKLLGKVDVIVTDSPVLLSSHVYAADCPEYFAPALRLLTEDAMVSWDTLDVFLKRDVEGHPYNPAGRNQTLDEASALDERIKGVLVGLRMPFHQVPVLGAVDAILELIQLRRSPKASGFREAYPVLLAASLNATGDRGDY